MKIAHHPLSPPPGWEAISAEAARRQCSAEDATRWLLKDSTGARLTSSMVLDTLSIDVQTVAVGTTASISIHEVNALGVAQSLLSDLGTVTISGSAGVRTISAIALTVPAGLYMVRIQTNGTVTLNCALYSGPGVNTTGSGTTYAIRMYGNTSTTYSATAPDPGPNAGVAVAGTLNGYCPVFMTWSL
jgi:hypothetical protein